MRPRLFLTDRRAVPNATAFVIFQDRVWPIITNTEAIAIDHAWAGSPGTLHKTLQNGRVEIWAKPLGANGVAIMVLNVGTENATVAVSLADDVPGAPTSATSYRDVWEHRDADVGTGGIISVRLDVHDSLLAVIK